MYVLENRLPLFFIFENLTEKFYRERNPCSFKNVSDVLVSVWKFYKFRTLGFKNKFTHSCEWENRCYYLIHYNTSSNIELEGVKTKKSLCVIKT